LETFLTETKTGQNYLWLQKIILTRFVLRFVLLDRRNAPTNADATETGYRRQYFALLGPLVVSHDGLTLGEFNSEAHKGRRK
jgi:hypothetical protein